MFKAFLCGVAAAALPLGALSAAPAPAPARPELQAWVVTPGERACRIDLELTGRSGAVTPVSLVSDGAGLALRFVKDEVPERAFLPIGVDQKPYANLVTRGEEPKTGLIELSEETQAAIRRGSLLQVSWLAEEPLRASLAGSDQALPDLKTCGAQVAARYRARVTAETAARAQAEADARAKDLADIQLAAARAQADKAQAEADAERQRVAQEAQVRQAQAEAEARRRQQEDEDAAAYARGQNPPYPEPFEPRWRSYDPYRGW